MPEVQQRTTDFNRVLNAIPLEQRIAGVKVIRDGAGCHWLIVPGQQDRALGTDAEEAIVRIRALLSGQAAGAPEAT